MEQNIYYIPLDSNGWVLPALILAGIALLIISIFIKRRFLILPGILLIFAGAIIEHDITVLCGALGCATCIWIYLK